MARGNLNITGAFARGNDKRKSGTTWERFE